MNRFLTGLSNFSTRTVYTIYGLFATILIITFVMDNKKDNYIYLVIGLVFICFIGSYLINKASLYLEKISRKKASFSYLSLV